MSMYRDALEVQSASNLSGVVKAWGRAMDQLWVEARAQNQGTDYVNKHPVNVLFATQAAHLSGTTGDSLVYRKAMEACETKLALEG